MSEPDPFFFFQQEEEGEPGFFFHAEDVDIPALEEPALEAWLNTVVLREGKKLGIVNFIFCSDTFLHEINVTYLQHDTYTDIITFPYSEMLVSGDIYISTDRVKENAVKYGVPFDNELHRVIVHGVLHLCGYTDATPEEKKNMTGKENEYLQQLSSNF